MEEEGAEAAISVAARAASEAEERGNRLGAHSAEPRIPEAEAEELIITITPAAALPASSS